MTGLIAWLGRPELQAEYLRKMEAHRAAYHLRKGTYGEGKGHSFRACAVGCTLSDGDAPGRSNHLCYPDKLGWPVWLAYLQDKIFEGLPSPEEQAWPEDLMRAIPPGLPEAVFSRIRNRFLHDMLVQQLLPLVLEEGGAIRKAISGVVELFQRCLNGEAISQDEWRSAAVAARAASAAAEAAADAADAAAADGDVAAFAAAFAADAAAAAAAAAAADAADAAYAAAAAAADAAAAHTAAYAADGAAASADARAAFWRWAASHLLKLIGEESAAWEMARKPA